MSDEPLNFEEFRRRREENASTVRCAKCGEWIVATATKCPECGVNFQGEADGFALARSERGTQDFSRDRLLERSLADPRREREARSDFSGYRWRDEDFLEERLQQSELIDLLKRDERAGICDDYDHKDSREAISASHSSLVSAKYGIPSLEACWMKSIRCMPSSSAALPLEIVPRR